MSIYKVNQRKGLLERNRQLFSHAYFPSEKFDEVKYIEKRVFGRIRSTYIHLMGKESLELVKKDELIQKGELTVWVCELSDATQSGTFKEFVDACLKYELNRSGLLYTYKNISLKYKGDYKVENQLMNIDYKRLDSPYGIIERKSDEVKLDYNALSYTMRFDKA